MKERMYSLLYHYHSLGQGAQSESQDQKEQSELILFFFFFFHIQFELTGYFGDISKRHLEIPACSSEEV